MSTICCGPNAAVFGFLAMITGGAIGGSDVTAKPVDTLGQPPPPGAVVLFDGKDLSAWVRRQDREPADWNIENGYVEVTNGRGYILTKEKFGDCRLHVEFWVPLMADKSGQERGNSGVYIQGRYEIQVLDSFNNPTYPAGACGALYDIIAPSVNASKPPEQWQAFDITFKAPRVDAQGKVVEKGEVTVVHNGITVIDRGKFDHITDTKHGTALDEKLGEPGPLMLQNHGAKVRFRNIWLVPASGK